jgi:hypothetical protein
MTGFPYRQQRSGAPHLARFSRDVGYHGTQRAILAVVINPDFPASPPSPATTCVVLSKENHMQLIAAATLDRNPGKPRDLQFISDYVSLSANKCSATRIALAMIVNDGFTALADTKQEASTT